METYIVYKKTLRREILRVRYTRTRDIPVWVRWEFNRRGRPTEYQQPVYTRTYTYEEAWVAQSPLGGAETPLRELSLEEGDVLNFIGGVSEIQDIARLVASYGSIMIHSKGEPWGHVRHGRVHRDAPPKGWSKKDKVRPWLAVGKQGDSAFKFGIELELECTRREEEYPVKRARQLIFKQRKEHGWKVHRDGSLTHGAEIVSPVMDGGDLEAFSSQISSICEALRPEFKADTTCGLHVHVSWDSSATDRDEEVGIELCQAIAGWVLNGASEFPSILPKRRIENSDRYCRLSPAPSYTDRYQAVNLISEHGTVEFRIGAGTLEAEEIVRWVKVLIGLCKHARKKAADMLLESEPESEPNALAFELGRALTELCC